MALPSCLRVALDLVAVALIGLFLATFVHRNVAHQGDLMTYRLAARAALDGSDPYQPENLYSLAGRRVFPFVYPPIALVPFLALVALPAKAVASIWMWGKIALLGVLVALWVRRFVPRAGLLPLALVSVFGWNSSAQWDLASGNVALVECSVLWLAFLCFAAGRRTAFTLLVVAAACFKLTSAAFLLLLLVPTGKPNSGTTRLVLALALMAALVGGPLLFTPASHWHAFWRHVPNANGYGDSNPSAIGLLTTMFQGAGLQDPLVVRLASLGWVLYVVALLATSFPLLRRLWQNGTPHEWVMSAVILYVLLLPRPMAYGYALLAPAPLFFSPRPFHGPVGRWVLVLILSAQGLSRLTNVRSGSLMVTYAPFLLTLCLWMLIVSSRRESPAGTREGYALLGQAA